MAKKSRDQKENREIPEKDERAENIEINDKNVEVEKNPDFSASDGCEEVLVLSKAEVDEMKEKLHRSQQKEKENLESWQRERADFINYKKRIDREQEILQQNYKAELLKKYLVILDDLELAMRNKPEEGEDPTNWIRGIELILRKFESINQNEGLKKIEAEGQEFDPRYHQAISHEEDPNVESGKIIEVLQNGYMLGDRVIRPALVRVAK